jgi:hypothetical protein
MNETPNEPLGPDEDRHRQQNDPAANEPGGQSPPPGDEDDDEDDLGEEQAPSRRRILSAGRLAAAGVVVVALLGGGAALALNRGDDDSTSSSDGDASSLEDAAFEFAECMRDNGLEDFPDPQVDADGGIDIGGSAAEQRDTEKFQAAQEACEHILEDAVPEGEGEKLTPEELAELRDQWQAVAQCVRDRGYDFAAPEIDEYGRLMGIQAGAEGVEQAIEDCANETGLDEPPGGEPESSEGEDGDA